MLLRDPVFFGRHMNNKVLIARNGSFRNGIKIADICNKSESHNPSWLIRIKKGDYVESYGVYAENHESAIAAFCRYEISQRKCGKGGLVKTIVEVDPSVISPRMESNAFIGIDGKIFCVNGIEAERARFVMVSARYESMLTTGSLDSRLNNVKSRIAEILLNKNQEKLEKAYEVYEALGGDVIGKNRIKIELSSSRGKFDTEIFVTDLMHELGQRGIHSSSFHLDGGGDFIYIDTNEFEKDRIMKAVDKIALLDPTGVVVSHSMTIGESKYIKEIGKNSEHAMKFVSHPSPGSLAMSA